jgi:TnpA family transposase
MASKVCCILQLGYFKANKMFYVFDLDEAKRDIRWVIEHYFPELNSTNIKIPKSTRIDQQARILDLFEYRLCDQTMRANLLKKALQLARISSNPVFVFKALAGYLDKNRVILPAYSSMQDIISKALAKERQRLAKIARKHINADIRKDLENLLDRQDSLYFLTILKKDPKDFGHRTISQEIYKQSRIKLLYLFAAQFLPNLEISNENIKYFSSLVDYYSIYKIKRLESDDMARVYLLCFIYHRYQRINDNLIKTFIYYVRKFNDLAKGDAKDRVYALKTEGNKHLDDASRVLNIFMDERIPNEIPFGEVKDMAFKILEREKFPLVLKYISRKKFDEAEIKWQHLEDLSARIKKNIRPLFRNTDFKSTSKNDPLINATDFLKVVLSNKRSLRTIKTDDFPKALIKRKQKRYLFRKVKIKIGRRTRRISQMIADRYEFYVYDLLRKHLEAGDVFIDESVHFRSFENDLVDDRRWRNKGRLIQELGLAFLQKPIKNILEELKEEFETLLLSVNRRIQQGENQHIKLRGTGENITWRLPYKKAEDATNHPLYDHLPQIEIRDLLGFVNAHCSFMNAFTHMLGRYTKSEADNDTIFGCIIAMGTNKGLAKMAESSDLAVQALFSASNNFIRLETLKDANDAISNATVRLSIFKYFAIEDGIIHSSSDGQKFETRINTFNARHSPKYFGLKKGVVSYTMVANHVPVNAKIIEANEHESHFVFDIIHNNTSDIPSNRHSVDTHGTNNVNFLILHAFGYEFAPRYKDINSKTETIYGFKHPKHYDGLLIKPAKKANEKLIINEWPNIQRVLVSLGLKTTTQSIIVGKLSSYERKNRTKKAMWELDNIFRSIYVLNYVDNLLLRQNVHRVLNRGEAYHQLRRAIPHANQGKFRVKTEHEQQIWSECSRLIANSIIFYNAFILSELLTHLMAKQKDGLVDIVKRVSPVAWRHVNLGGRFKFNSKRQVPNIDGIIAALEEVVTDLLN